MNRNVCRQGKGPKIYTIEPNFVYENLNNVSTKPQLLHLLGNHLAKIEGPVLVVLCRGNVKPMSEGTDKYDV